jgi:lipoate-protein ligase B
MIFELFLPEFTEGKEAVISKNGALDQQQISAVSRMIAGRQTFKDNGKEALDALIDVLKNESKKREYDKKIEENPVSALDEYIKGIKATRKEDK